MHMLFTDNPGTGKTTVALNPGLKRRIPHQIHFPDYDANELYQIFNLQLGADYILTELAAKKLEQLFAKAATIKSCESGNGRFVRNLVERLKMKQGCRLVKDGHLGKEDFQQINEEDVDSLLIDTDILKGSIQSQNRVIGYWKH